MQNASLNKGLIFHAPLTEWQPDIDLVTKAKGTVTDVIPVLGKGGEGRRWYEYNGTSDYMLLPTSMPVFSTGDFTITAKIKTGAIGAIRTIIGGATGSFELYISATGYLTAKKYGGSALTASTTQLAANTEYSIAYKRGTTTGTYYVNGVAAGTCTDANSYTVKCTLAGNGTGFFNGGMSMLRAFNYSGTPTQVINYSKPEYPIEWVDRGYSMDLVSGWNFTSGWFVNKTASISNLDTYVTSAITGSGIYKLLGLAVGKDYRIAVTASGNNVKVLHAADESTIGSGSGSYDFTATSSTGVILSSTTASATVNIASMTLNQLGCILDLNAEGATPTYWYDKTNSLTATVSGADLIKPVASNLGASYANGTTSKVAFTGMNGLTGDISISARIRLNAFGEGNVGRIIDNSKCILYTNSSGYLTFTRNGSTYINSGAASIAINTWYDIVVTSTSAGVTNFYINGVLSGTANQSAGTPVSATSLNLLNNAASSATFNGIQDDIRIYNEILDINRIQNLANGVK